MPVLPMFEAVAAAGALFVSGTISGVSMLAIPVALDTAENNAALLKQWRTIYLNGHIKGPAIALTVGTAMAVIAGLKYRDGADATTSVVAAVATAGIVPYTWVVMNGVNRSLHSFAAGAGSDAVDARKFVIRWSRMNAVRGALPLMGGLVCLWGIVSS